MSKAMKELKNPQLKTMLNKVGKTPLDEPEIFNLGKDNPSMAIFEIANFVIERAKKDIESFDNDELALFYRLVSDRVMNVKYASGEFKSTPNTKELENISFKDRVKLFDLSQKASEIEADDKEATDALVKEQQAFIWKTVNINKKPLTEWEVNLVEAIVMSQALQMAQTALDVDLGN